MTESKTKALEKANASGFMRTLIRVADEATGVYSEHADEHMTVHVGGRTCAYTPRHASHEHARDPVLAYVHEHDAYRIKRTAVCRTHRQGETESVPRHTIEVV